jgi:hypothetical protein
MPRSRLNTFDRKAIAAEHIVDSAENGETAGAPVRNYIANANGQ